MEDFVIDQVSWHTKGSGSGAKRSVVIKRFKTLADFLDNNGLTKKKLISAKKKIDDKFSIKSSDLTEEGLEFVRNNYERWLSAIDRGKNPEDSEILKKGLEKMKGK